MKTCNEHRDRTISFTREETCSSTRPPFLGTSNHLLKTRGDCADISLSKHCVFLPSYLFLLPFIKKQYFSHMTHPDYPFPSLCSSHSCPIWIHSLFVSHWKTNRLLRDNNTTKQNIIRLKKKKPITSELDKTNKQKQKSPRESMRVRDPLIHALGNPIRTRSHNI